MAGFGAKVKLSVDRSGDARKAFNDQINSLINQIKISNKFIVLQKDMNRVREDAESMLNKSPIKITNIDCSKAVDKLRKDLQNVINSLSIKNGVTITGLVDPGGAGELVTQIDDITAAAARGQEELNRYNAQMSTIKDSMKSLKDAFQSVLPGGKNEIDNTVEVNRITEEYNNLAKSVADYETATTKASAEELSGFQVRINNLREEIQLIEEKRVAAEKAAADETAQSKVRKNILKEELTSLRSMYTSAKAGGKYEIADEAKLAEIAQAFDVIEKKITDIRVSTKQISAEELSGFQVRINNLREEIQLIEEKRVAAEKAAADETAQSKVRKNILKEELTSLRSMYTSAKAGGKYEIADEAKLAEIAQAFDVIEKKITDIRVSTKQISAEELSGLTQEISSIKDSIIEASNATDKAVEKSKAQAGVLKETIKTLDTAWKTAEPSDKNDPDAVAEFDALSAKYSQLKQDYQEMKKAGAVASQERIAALQQEADAILDVVNANNEVKNSREHELDIENKRLAAIEKVNKLLGQTKKNKDDWTAAQYGNTADSYKGMGEAIDELEKLQKLLDAAKISTEASEAALKSYDQAYKKAKSDISGYSEKIKAAGKNTKTLSEHIGNLASKFASWLSVSQVIMYIYNGMKKMVVAVKEVDAAMTELRKVTDETEEAYERFLNTAASRAKVVGATISDVVNATADFARLGYDIADASTLADAAIIYKNVGDGIESIDQASESIISTMQAFGVEASNVMSIVDKFNIVGNNFAISSTGVGEALLNSASALSAAGNTLDESIALITAANEVIQDPQKVGTAMKTLSMYIRAAKTEAEEAGIATDGMANSVSELRGEILALTGNEVDIMIDDTTFKSTVDIIRDLSKVWGGLNDITRANITELIGGGVRNANVVSALLNNFSTVEEVIATAANSAGSALAENEKYLDSIAGKISEFKATFDELSTTLIDSDFVKQIVEFGTGLLNILSSVARVIDSIGGLNTVLISTIGILAIIKRESIEKFLLRISSLFNTAINVVKRAPIVFKSFKSSTALAIPGTSKFSATLKALGISASTTQVAITGLSLAIMAAVWIYSSHQQALRQQKEAAIEAANAFNETSTSLEEYKSKAIELRKAIDSGNLSEEEAYNKREELISIQKSLVEMFGKEAEGINLVTGSIDSQIEAINRLKKAEWGSFEQENTAAINDAIDLFTNRNDWKKVYGIDIDIPSRGVLNTAANNLGIDIDLDEFYDKLEQGLRDMDINIPIGGVIGQDFWSYFEGDIYDVLDAYQALYKITEDLGKEYFGIDKYMEYVGGSLESYSKEIGKIKSQIEESETLFNTHVEGLLNYEDRYSKVWGEVLAARKEYDEALLAGDNSAVLVAAERMKKAEEAFLESGWDNAAVNTYLSNYFDEWDKAFASNQFEVEVKARLSDDKSFENDIKEALKAFENEDGVVDVYRILNIEATGDSIASEAEIQAYNELKKVTDDYGVSVGDLCNILLELGYVQDNVGEPIPAYTAQLYKLTDVLSELQTAYSVLETAENDMASGKGLSVETVKALAAAEEDYLSYIYEENGVLKLNTEAWKENANAKMQHDMAEIEREIRSLADENELLAEKNETLQESLEYYREQRALANDGGIWNDKITEVTQAIEENNIAIAENSDEIRENQGLLAVYGALYSDIVGDVSAYTAALENFASVAGVIDSVATSYAGLYNLQQAVAEGFTFSLDKILEYAKAYPEILNNATVTADGELALNEAVVNSFIKGREELLRAQIDSQIAELKGDKAVLESKKVFAEAQLEIAKAIGEGEGQISKEAAQYKLNVGNAVLKAMIDNGIEEADAYRLAAVSMSDNINEFNRVVLDVCTDIDGNFNAAAYNAAMAMYRNANSMQQNLSKVAEQAHETARAISGAGKGLIAGVARVIGGLFGAKDNGDDKEITTTETTFDGSEYVYEEKTYSLDDYISKLELDIKDFDDAISQINGQIATLEALRDTPFDKFKNLVDNASSIVGEKTNQKIEKEKKDAEKTAKDSAKLVEEYIAAIDEYYDALKRLEEAQERRTSLEKKLEHTEDLSHKIFLSSGLIDAYKEEAEAEKNLVAAKQATISANVGALRRLGFQVNYDAAANKLYIKNLEHLNELTANSAGKYETLQEATNALRKETEELIDTTEQLNKDNIESVENVEDLGYQILETKNNIIDYIEEVYDKQVESYRKIIDLRKELIESAKDEYDYEADIAEKVKEIADLQSRIDQLALDDSRSAQAERASLMEELAEKQKDLADTQNDHATDSQLETLDKMAEDYEEQRASEIEALRATVTESEELWNSFYQTILGNTAVVGASIDSQIANAWIRAAQAVNDYSAAVSGIYSGSVLATSIPKYHTGGVVDKANINQDEALAILQKGEVVLNDGKQQTLYKIIDFQEELSKRLGTMIGSLTLPDISGGIRSMLSNAVNSITAGSQSMVFEPHIQVEIHQTVT